MIHCETLQDYCRILQNYFIMPCKLLKGAHSSLTWASKGGAHPRARGVVLMLRPGCAHDITPLVRDWLRANSLGRRAASTANLDHRKGEFQTNSIIITFLISWEEEERKKNPSVFVSVCVRFSSSLAARWEDGGERGRHAEHADWVWEQIFRVRWSAAAALLQGEDGGDRELLPEK